MLIHLKRNEKLYLNGAVIRLDRRGTLELMNDASFLLENHILQPEEATTPLRQVYFVVQLMLMDPANAHLMTELFKVNVAQLRLVRRDDAYAALLDKIDDKVKAGNYFDAMKIIRQSYHLEKATEAERVSRAEMEAA
jgi:flagellar biosynthesis repressor protein FlbT